jgi:hypothetical protein
VPEISILVDRDYLCARIYDPDDMDPGAGLNVILKVAAAAPSTGRGEYVEADSLAPIRRGTGTGGRVISTGH